MKKKESMRGVLAALIALSWVFVAPPAATAQASQSDGPSIVTVVTASEAQTQLMAMVLSTQVVMQGASLHVLLCGPGGDLALRDAPESATTAQPPRGMSPQGMLQGLMERGVTVEVCAIYLPGLGADPSVLLEGVGVAQPPEMAAKMMAEGVRVWSF